MKKYILILVLIFTVHCHAGNTGGCDVNCSEEGGNCLFTTIFLSENPTTGKLDFSLYSYYVVACDKMMQQCRKRCDDNDLL